MIRIGIVVPRKKPHKLLLAHKRQAPQKTFKNHPQKARSIPALSNASFALMTTPATTLPNIEFHPVLALRPTEKIRFHEYPEQARTQRLTKRLTKDGLLRHPPIVSDIGGGDLLLLDGANRVSALKALGCEEIPVQLVNYVSPRIMLKGWHHLLLEAEELNLRQAFENLPNCQLKAIRADQVDAKLAFHQALAVLVEANGSCWALQAQPGLPNQTNTLMQRVNTMHQVVTCYEGKTHLERIKLADYTTLTQAMEGSTTRSVVLFPTLHKEELMQLVRNNAMMPTGLTRHLIPGRALGCNLPLTFLLPPSTQSSRHDFFNAWCNTLISKSRMRFYEESVFLLDE